ncbi:hypothetical protein [Streptomyces sp. NPDC059371]|uniref:hypothetical protein n=1 Tax=Streptomyces sp. NPDC059371 TaxID=3346812 RepID=UPI00368081C7
MATTPTIKRPAAAEQTEAVTETAEARPETAPRTAPTVVGPPLGMDEKPVTVTLSHHLRIDGTDYTPGAKVTVSTKPPGAAATSTTDRA